MSLPDLVIRGKRVVLPELSSHESPGQRKTNGQTKTQSFSRFRTVPASIHIRDGLITEIGAHEAIPARCEVFEVGHEAIVMPGLVDTHVHVNEPGRVEWEGFSSATRAAAAGGVTTLVDMPLNSIPATTTLAGFRAKLAAARGQCFVDVGFWGGVVPGNSKELAPLLAAGVAGFKCFLIDSGVDEFPSVSELDLREAMPELTRLGAVLIVHAELPGPINIIRETDRNDNPHSYKTFLDSRPRAAENEAVELMIRLGREFGTRVHIVHHSSSDALSILRDAKAAGVKITSETCPHYLYFVAEEIADRATEFKCCPPIRESDNRERLWQALADGTIEMIVSDHSPCPPEMKLRDSGDFLRAWGGISSLQLRLPVVWTEARKRGHSIEDLVRWLCQAPADLVGLATRKGRIAPGCDADIVVWNPAQEFQVEATMLHHRHKLTPYLGQVLQGVVRQTFLRGKKVYDGGEFLPVPQGVLL